MALKLLHLLLVLSFLGADAVVFTLQNKCKNTIWPGIQSGEGKSLLMNGGLRLRPGETVNISAPEGWSGKFWGRRRCSFDRSGQGTCLTGDCGGNLLCNGVAGAPPATLAEFILDSQVDYYDVSLVDGYNMRVSIIPWGGSGSCRAIGCDRDLNHHCPKGLEVKENGRVVACKSACLAFDEPEYCCTGAYSSAETCKPTHYSNVFKAACPTAYTYAYDDDSTSLFTCKGANYLIRLC